MIQEHCLGKIVDIKEGGEVVIKATLPNLHHALDRQYNNVEIILPDEEDLSLPTGEIVLPDPDEIVVNEQDKDVPELIIEEPTLF